ncbi:MAG: GntR family transcriptional regulator [Rhodomicrobiaceae bacterium]
MDQTSRPKKTQKKDALSRIPRYLQVATALRQRINSGQWTVGSKIATLEQLENEFQVARVTIRQAVDLLQQEGLLKSEQGRGTFVIKSQGPGRWLQLATDWHSLMEPIKHNTLKLLPVETPYPPRIEAAEGIPAAAYAHIYSLQLRGEQPYALVRVHVAKDIYDRAPETFQKQVALGVLADMKDVRIARAHQTLLVGSADVHAAVDLRLPFGAPVVEARCVVSDVDERVIYVGEIVYRGDVVRINIELLNGER